MFVVLGSVGLGCDLTSNMAVVARGRWRVDLGRGKDGVVGSAGLTLPTRLTGRGLRHVGM